MRTLPIFLPRGHELNGIGWVIGLPKGIMTTVVPLEEESS
jgi:hypothetical protein